MASHDIVVVIKAVDSEHIIGLQVDNQPLLLCGLVRRVVRKHHDLGVVDGLIFTRELCSGFLLFKETVVSVGPHAGTSPDTPGSQHAELWTLLVAYARRSTMRLCTTRRRVREVG